MILSFWKASFILILIIGGASLLNGHFSSPYIKESGIPIAGDAIAHSRQVIRPNSVQVNVQQAHPICPHNTVFVSSYFPFEQRNGAAIFTGCCANNQCAKVDHSCVNSNTLMVGGYICGSDGTWSYTTQSYVPGEDRTHPPARLGGCPQRNQCIRQNKECVAESIKVGDLTCGPNGNWGYATKSYVPNENRNNPPARQGICQQVHQCIRSNHECVNIGFKTANLECSQDGNWGIFTQSYVSSENRDQGAARQGVCPQPNQCIAADGTCHDEGTNRAGFMCFQSNWLACGKYHSWEPQQDALWRSLNPGTGLNFISPPNPPLADHISQVGEFDVIGDYVCRNGHFQQVSCSSRHPIMTDVFIDTRYVSVSDETIRESFSRASKYLCAQTPNQNYEYQVRNIYRTDLGRTPTSNDLLDWYQQHQVGFPEYLVWFGYLDEAAADGSTAAGLSYRVFVDSDSYCNRYPPAEQMIINIQDPYNPRTSTIYGGPKYFQLAIFKTQDYLPTDDSTVYFLNGHSNQYGFGGNMNRLINHEFLHAYGNGHYAFGYDFSFECIGKMNLQNYNGRKADEAGICPDGIAGLLSGTHQCPGSQGAVAGRAFNIPSQVVSSQLVIRSLTFHKDDSHPKWLD